jgi:hypothetical protein
MPWDQTYKPSNNSPCPDFVLIVCVYYPLMTLTSIYSVLSGAEFICDINKIGRERIEYCYDTLCGAATEVSDIIFVFNSWESRTQCLRNNPICETSFEKRNRAQR